MSSEDERSINSYTQLLDESMQEIFRKEYDDTSLLSSFSQFFGRSEIANLTETDLTDMDFTDADFDEFVNEHEGFFNEDIGYTKKHFDFITYYKHHRKDGEDMPFGINEISVGQRVKLNENYENRNIEIWISQSGGGMGVITDRPCAGGDLWVSVDWDNGHKNSYHKAALIFEDDCSCYNYAGNNYIAGDNIGWHVVERQSTDPVKIQQSAQKRRNEVEELYKLPLLPGMRVCLNPETENYQYLFRYTGSSVGYITKALISDEHLLQWKNRSPKSAYNVVVRFDSNKEYTLHLQQLLPVEAPSITIIYISLSNGNSYFLFEKDNTAIIEDQIITHRAQIINRKVYDEKWRTEIYEKISSQS